MCVCVCVSLASDSSATIEVIIIKLGTVTASDMPMHHVTFIHGRTDLNHENNKWLIVIVSETSQAIPIKFSAVKIVRLRVYMTIASPVTLTFIQGHK